MNKVVQLTQHLAGFFQWDNVSDLLHWTFKAILLPLIPFWLGALVRYLCLGFSTDIFGMGDLCFSLGMLFLLISTSAGKLNDDKLRSSITTWCYLAAAIFVILFVFSTTFETLLVDQNRAILSDLNSKLQDGSPIPASYLADHAGRSRDRYDVILGRLRVCVLLFMPPAIIFAYVLHYRYDLEA